MDNTEILKQVEAVFRDVLDNEAIVLTPATTAADVDEWDSLTHVELVVAVEHRFSVKLTSSEILSWRNVGDMVACLAAHLA